MQTKISFNIPLTGKLKLTVTIRLLINNFKIYSLLSKKKKSISLIFFQENLKLSQQKAFKEKKHANA